MALDEYRRKRCFDNTPEPSDSGKLHKSPSMDSGELRFVVQKHDASRLHYDLRLELGGVLLSWVIPKGPSLDPQDKRLAIQVEDHPVEYCEFEGTIPAGEYGGGTILVWDVGTWQPFAADGYQRGELKFELRGQKLRGRWMLVQTGKRGGDPKHWLLFKERDQAARSADDFDILSAYPDSVLSGRTMRDIAAEAAAAWTSAGTARRKAEGSNSTISPFVASPRVFNLDQIRGARRRAMPTSVPRPMLPTMSREAPNGEHWLHEIKYDGYRMICLVRDGKARFFSRNGNDWTDKVPTLTQRMSQLPVAQAIFDGEVAALSADGTTDFQALQNTIGRGQDEKLKYYLFDVLYLNGTDLTGVHLAERKRLLRSVIPTQSDGPLQFSEHIQGDGPTVFHHACRLGAEGIVSKRVDRKYVSGRSNDWLKTKSLHSAEFVIGGYTKSTTTSDGFASLLLGAYDGEDLVYLGRVGTGFSDQTRETLLRTLQVYKSDRNPFANLEANMIERQVVWLEPTLVAEVAFGGWTADTLLRFPSFRGMRADIAPKQVVLSDATRPLDVSASQPRPRDAEVANVASNTGDQSGIGLRSVPLGDLSKLKLTHPDRVMYPDCGVTKLAVAEHYLQVAEAMLPHVIDRPLALVRCPQGISQRCFFQKKRIQGMPDSVRSARLSLGGKQQQDAVFVRDLAGLISLVQFSALEIHTWGSRVDRPERPDRMIFDLDPDASLPFARVCAAALEVRDVLEALGLVSFVKTTGGKGLHIVVPIRRSIEWPVLHDFTAHLAGRIQGAAPARYTTSSSKRSRKGKIYLDYLRNSFGATSIAPYSTRSRPGAPVSTPIEWEELGSMRSANSFAVGNIQRRLSNQRQNPWAAMADVKQAITKSMIHSIKR